MTETQKSYHHGDLRRALIQTAMDILKEDEGWQFTLRELARRAGVSHAAPYKHFDDKAALLAELAIQGFERLQASLEKASTNDPAASRQDFLKMCLAYVDFGTANPNLYRLMWSADARLANNPRLVESANQAFRLLRDAIARGQALGWLRNGDPAKQAVAVWTQLHGLALLSFAGLLESLTKDPIRGSIGELLTGLEKGSR